MALYTFKKASNDLTIIIEPDLITELKAKLQDEGKQVAKFEVVDFGWGGPIYDIVPEEQNDDYTLFDVEGLKFAADKSVEEILRTVEIINDNGKITVKKTGCCP